MKQEQEEETKWTVNYLTGHMFFFLLYFFFN